METGLISKSWLIEEIEASKYSATASRQLFALVMLEIWLQLFLNRGASVNPPDIRLEDLLNM